MSVQGFGWAVDPIRAAGGRAHYNSIRQLRARDRQRRVEVAWLTVACRGGFHGSQATVARMMGVSEATVSRDLAAIHARNWAAAEPLPCGHRPLPRWPAEDVAAALDRPADRPEEPRPELSPAAAEYVATTPKRTVRMMARSTWWPTSSPATGCPTGCEPLWRASSTCPKRR